MISDGEISFRLLAVASTGAVAAVWGAARRPVVWRRVGIGSVAWLASACVAFLVPRSATLVNVSDGPLLARAGGSVAVGVCGLAFVLVGLRRGRRVGDHEHCRRCGFDLTGRPADARACSECGSPLHARRAIVVGERRRRPIVFAVGAVVALASIVAGRRDVPAAWTAIRRDPELVMYRLAWTPEFLLLAELDDPTAAGFWGQPWAGYELEARYDAGKLSRATIAKLATWHQVSSEGFEHLFTVGQAEPIALKAWADGRLDESIIRRVLRDRAGTATLALPRGGVTVTRLPFKVGFEDLHSLADRSPVGMRLSVDVVERHDTIDGVDVAPGEIVDVSPQPISPPRAWYDSDPWWTPFGRVYRLARPLAGEVATVRSQMTVAVELSAPGRPTLREVVSLELAATAPVIVEAASTSVAAQMPELFAKIAFAKSWTGHPEGKLMVTARDKFAAATAPPFVGDVFLRDAAGHERLMSEIELMYSRGVTPIDVLPGGPFAVVLRPAHDLRLELGAASRPRETFQHELVIDATRIERVAKLPDHW